jgi:hypothetical protein
MIAFALWAVLRDSKPAGDGTGHLNGATAVSPPLWECLERRVGARRKRRAARAEPIARIHHRRFMR